MLRIPVVCRDGSHSVRARLTLLVGLSTLAVGLPAQDWRQALLGERMEHALAFDTGRGVTVLFGGRTTNDFPERPTYQADTWEYAGGQWRYVPTVNAPGPRVLHAMAYDAARNRVVLFGGNAFNTFPIHYLDETWEYDGATWVQVQTAVAPSPRNCCSLAYDAARARTVLFGGGGDGGVVMGDTWDYDGSQWVLRAPATAPPARLGAGLAYDGARARTVMFGGFGSALFNDTWEFDGSNWLQAAPASSPTPRSRVVLAYDAARARTVLFGGRDFGGMLGETWEYDGATWAQTTPAASPARRICHGLAYDGARARIVLYGGREVEPSLFGRAPTLRDTWEYDGANWNQTATGNQSPGPTWGAAMVHDPVRARSLLFGGTLTQAWEFDGASWTPVATASPPPRQFLAFAHDLERRRSVVFGGRGPSNGQFLGDTWEFDGVNWTSVATAATPSARTSPAMAYDPGRRRIVLFGGVSGPINVPVWMDDTWEYDGVQWTPVFPAARPAARSGHTMAHDLGRGRTVMFGGGGHIGPAFTDTWEYDGSNWALIATATQPPVGGGMVYDAVRGRTILCIAVPGYSHSDFMDTWEYDGSNWQQLALAHRPQWRSAEALTYDLGRARVVLYSGSEDLADTWELLPSATPSWSRYGLGCAGSAGTPQLDAGSGSLPALGSTFQLQLGALPGATFLLFGFDLAQWNGLPLPVDFDPSRPHCDLWIGPAPGASFLLLPAAGAATFPLAIPSSSVFAGLVLGAQAIALDGSVPAGFALSNGGILRVD